MSRKDKLYRLTLEQVKELMPMTKLLSLKIPYLSTRVTIAGYIRSGELKAYNLSTKAYPKWFFKREDVEDFISKRRRI